MWHPEGDHGVTIGLVVVVVVGVVVVLVVVVLVVVVVAGRVVVVVTGRVVVVVAPGRVVVVVVVAVAGFGGDPKSGPGRFAVGIGAGDPAAATASNQASAGSGTGTVVLVVLEVDGDVIARGDVERVTWIPRTSVALLSVSASRHFITAIRPSTMRKAITSRLSIRSLRLRTGVVLRVRAMLRVSVPDASVRVTGSKRYIPIYVEREC